MTRDYKKCQTITGKDVWRLTAINNTNSFEGSLVLCFPKILRAKTFRTSDEQNNNKNYDAISFIRIVISYYRGGNIQSHVKLLIYKYLTIWAVSSYYLCHR